MTTNGTSLAIADFYAPGYSPSAGFDLNEAIRILADIRQDECRANNIAVITVLAAGLPRTAVDGEQLNNVLCVLFAEAQRAILDSGNPGRIVIYTELKAGRMQLSLTHDGAGAELDLAVCAEIIQDQSGELYRWRPRDSARQTIIIDLPI